MAEITFITGSTLGSAEYVAEHLADILAASGHSTELLHGAELDEVTQSGIWLLVCSTHGAGEIPDNLLDFSQSLTNQRPDLHAVRYGAIGLGNREYDLFCGAIHKLDQQLQDLGATRIGDLLEIDMLEDEIPEDPAERWLNGWVDKL